MMSRTLSLSAPAPARGALRSRWSVSRRMQHQCASSTPGSRGESSSTEQTSVVEEKDVGVQSVGKYDGDAPKRFALDNRVAGRVVASSVTLALRLGSGALTAGWSGFGLGEGADASGYTFATVANRRITEKTDVTSFPRPEQPIILYEFEGCPFCKKVREACSYLDLDVLYYPCPRGSPNYRPLVGKEGGKEQFPYLVDPNVDMAMYESDDIIRYLFKTYGPGEDAEIPAILSSSPLNAISAGLSLLPRMGAGSTYTSAKKPEQPLVYWGYEASPFCKIVREVLCELELPHVMKNCARGSPKRDEMVEKYGLFQVPLLEDPNTGKAFFESAQIIEYLEKEYSLRTIDAA
mmetsp:Transcript_4675/g.10455  ORF Transcript_4675/g.10455 Transcript_4675/m.10455 type:complete len:349 (+) Transcript_4675:31-1077(+)